MTNELSPKAASALIRNTFASKGVKATQTEALDLLARLKGFQAWSHMSNALKTSRSKTPQAQKTTQSPKTISLREVLIQHYGHWGSCPLYPRDDWKLEVENDNTPSGYFDWLISEIESRGEVALDAEYYVDTGLDVTLPDGTTAKWDMEVNLTDRWGDLNFHAALSKPGLAILSLDESLLEALRASMTDEITFVVRKDNEFGLLFEVEYCSQESEAPHDTDAAQYSPHAEIKQGILSSLKELHTKYPKVQFCVPDTEYICNDRPAAWGFFKIEDLSQDERHALSVAMSNLA